jgi:hypothetical protein
MNRPPKDDKARVQAGQGAKQYGHPNSSAAQRARLLEALRRGPVSTFRARSDLDIMHPGGRCMELRREGHLILTFWTREPSDFGRSHRVARYVLMREAQS